MLHPREHTQLYLLSCLSIRNLCESWLSLSENCYKMYRVQEFLAEDFGRRYWGLWKKILYHLLALDTALQYLHLLCKFICKIPFSFSLRNGSISYSLLKISQDVRANGLVRTIYISGGPFINFIWVWIGLCSYTFSDGII